MAQGTPRGADGHQKGAQRAPAEVPKERKIIKTRKLRHLDFERPYGALATFTPFGGARGRKKANENPEMSKILDDSTGEVLFENSYSEVITFE